MFYTLLFLASCGSDPDVDDSAQSYDPLSWSLLEEGPFQSGFQTWKHSYSAPVGQSPREIAINIWYPTTDESGETSAYLEGLYRDELAYLNASVAPSAYAQGYPVHVYSHGDRGWGATSANMMRFFASHGWIVIAPDHTDNTLLDSVDPRPTAHYIHRPLDIRASLDLLEEMDPNNPLSQANTDAVLLSGHSFGCYTAWANMGAAFDPTALEGQCLSLDEGQCTAQEMEAFTSGDLGDPRVVAGITMAGAIRRGFFGEEGHTAVEIPVMLMSGTEDHDGIPSSWESLQDMQSVSWLELEGGCHQTFAAGVCSTLEAALGFEAINAYALALGRQAVLDDQGDSVSQLLAGNTEISELATYSVGESTR